MPRLNDRTAAAQRRQMMQADRARGLTYRALAQLHGCGLSWSYEATRHVRVAHVWRPWHLARWRPEPAPAPVWWQVLPWV